MYLLAWGDYCLIQGERTRCDHMHHAAGAIGRSRWEPVSSPLDEILCRVITYTKPTHLRLLRRILLWDNNQVKHPAGDPRHSYQ